MLRPWKFDSLVPEWGKIVGALGLMEGTTMESDRKEIICFHEVVCHNPLFVPIPTYEIEIRAFLFDNNHDQIGAI